MRDVKREVEVAMEKIGRLEVELKGAMEVQEEEIKHKVCWFSSQVFRQVEWLRDKLSEVHPGMEEGKADGDDHGADQGRQNGDQDVKTKKKKKKR